MPHGHPGTPVGDLFPPGASVLGAGGGLGRQALPRPSSHEERRKDRGRRTEDERGREGGREFVKGGREGGREGGRKRGREEKREGGRGGREAWREIE